MKWKILTAVILTIAIIFIFIHNTLTPIFISLAEVEGKRMAHQAIYNAVQQEAQGIDYQDLVQYVYNNDGEISLMQPNIKYINNFTSRVSLDIQQNMQNIAEKKVSIPLLSVLGIDLLAALGPDLQAVVIPAGFNQPPELKDSFIGAGINQTRHRIYLHVVLNVKLVVPFRTQLIDVQADIPVTEVVIIGRVPRVYIGLDKETLPGVIGQQE